MNLFVTDQAEEWHQSAGCIGEVLSRTDRDVKAAWPSLPSEAGSRQEASRGWGHYGQYSS